MTKSTIALPRTAQSKSATPRALIIPLVAFQAVACFLPQLYFYSMAFAKGSGVPGRFDSSVFTLDNLGVVFGNSLYRDAIWETLFFALAVVGGVILLGFPVAYTISRSALWRPGLLGVVIVSSFTSVIIKVLGWKILLGDAGPINSMLMSLHIIPEPIQLVNNMTGAVVGTINAVLPLAVLLMIPVVDQLPRSIEDAAAGLGASRARTIFAVILPMSRAGLLGAGFVTFAYAMGSFTTPALLGGTSSILPVLIAQQVRTSVNYPLAASFALVLMAMVVMILLVATQFDRRRTES